MARPKQTELDGFREACEDAMAKLDEAEAMLDQALIPERDRNALGAWTMRLKYESAALANKAGCIGNDLKVAA